MIVRPRPRMRELFFIWKGSIIPLILPQVLFVTVVAAVVTSTAGAVAAASPHKACTTSCRQASNRRGSQSVCR